MKTWWGTRQNISNKLRLEVSLMREAFQDTFKLVVPPLGKGLYWLGKAEINMSSRFMKQREHTMKILYPDDYPSRPPEAYVVSPRIYSEKHQFEDGQLCLFNPKDGETYGWNPAESTAVTVVTWAIQWLYTYYTWREIGQWVGAEERIRGREWD